MLKKRKNLVWLLLILAILLILVIAYKNLAEKTIAPNVQPIPPSKTSNSSSQLSPKEEYKNPFDQNLYTNPFSAAKNPFDNLK